MQPQSYTHAALVHRVVKRTYNGSQGGGNTYHIMQEHKNDAQAVTEGQDIPLICQEQQCTSTFDFRLYTKAQRKSVYLARLKKRIIVFGCAYVAIVVGAMLNSSGSDTLAVRVIGFTCFFAGAGTSIVVLLMIIFGRPPKYLLRRTSGPEWSKGNLSLEHSIALTNNCAQ